jgi:hypothetical protein
MKSHLRRLAPLWDIFLVPFTLAGAVVLSFIRRVGVERMPLSRAIFRRVGVFPIVDHYYEPLFDPKHIRRPLSEDRGLYFNLNIDEQLSLLKSFHYAAELERFPLNKTSQLEYFYHNGAFGAGDAEFLYNMVRLYKPSTIVEIGSGNSTLMAINAIERNTIEDAKYRCNQICIEPYEHEWLRSTNVTLVRQVVERVDKALFADLKRNDILFIDSSHMIRPQGDVLYEYFEILPILGTGVIVHIHDIFTPKDYPHSWVFDIVRFWNEQYLLEAFLMFNKEFRVLGALNFLKHNYFGALSSRCPVLEKEPSSEPSSFWIVKT